MDLSITFRDAEMVTHGTVLQGEMGAVIKRICTDTRAIQSGDTFLAIKGDKFDGNDYQLQAAEKGATGFIVQRRNNRIAVDAPVLRVPDTTIALQDIAGLHRSKFKLKVAAVVGTNGKTTTKQILAAICAAAGKTVATQGNLNNQWGLPMSLLEIKAEHQYGVFEMGSAKRGDIEVLAKIAKPDVAVYTNIGRAHLEFFGSMQASLETEWELVDVMGTAGKVAINLDDPLLEPKVPWLQDRAVTFGVHPKARVRLVLEPEPALIIDGRPLPLEPREKMLLYHPMNAAAAAAGAIALGLTPEHIAKGFQDFKPAPLRMEKREHKSGAIFLVDAYNANPDSVRESLKVFLSAYPGKDKVVVLGDMKELGKDSALMHAEVGAYLKTLPLKAVFLAGPEMEPAEKAIQGAGFPFTYSVKPELMLGELKHYANGNTAFLFKASRAMALEKLAEAI